jgi:hypothetical protein
MGSNLTLADYFMGRDVTHAEELDETLHTNARVIVARANELLRLTSRTHVRVNSGWRPRSINAAIANASPRSRHLTCQAIDLADEDGALDTWCMNNIVRLEALGLWLEHPDATPGWCHVQTVPPRSGRRVFRP